MNVPPNIPTANTYDVKSVNRVVCILSYTSSASCLMSSLLDNHPNVLDTPDNILGDFQSFWEEHGHLRLDPLLSEFLDRYIMIFDARMKRKGYEGTVDTGETHGFTTLGPNRDECLEVDHAAFKNEVRHLIGETYPVPKKLFFQALHVAYSRASGRGEADNPIIVFGLHSLHYEGRLEGLTDDFSDVYLLQMVRHPLRATASRVRTQIRTDQSVAWGFCKSIAGVSTSGVNSPLVDTACCRAVRMEDLHNAPEQTMRKICEWLDLPWDDSLLESTINGKQWWNGKHSAQVSGFNPSIAAQTFEEYLPSFDRFRLGILLGRKCSAWEYPVHRWSQNLLARVLILPFLMLPFKMELMIFPSLTEYLRTGEGTFLKRIQNWLRGLGAWLVKGRVELLKAWLILVSGRHSEVQLL